ncbi:MAG: hypothetical protein MUO27_08730, partial [Sedimentisphaerales bacterium]|nr:hypothetical protein [Sedimentisphaerales bacterium]
WIIGTTHAKKSGYNKALIFVAHAESSSSINLSSVTYGGQSMTKVIDFDYYAASGHAYAAAFILKETGVAAATNGTFTLTWSGTAPTSDPGYASVFLSNVDQTTPTGAEASNGTTTANPVTTSALATSNGDMVIDAATCGNSGSYTLNNSFIEGIDQQMTGGVTGVTGHKSATGANETPSATYSSTINRQMIIGFVVKGGGVTGNVSGGAGYIRQSTAGLSSGTPTFSLTASNEARALTIAIAPADAISNNCCGDVRP